jgi:DEAD/DEAH box helicase domain-containing protein
MDLLARFIREVRQHRELGPEVVHQEDLPPHGAITGEFPAGLAPELAAGLRALGIRELYLHQSEAIGRALAGEDLVVVTPTASGKTLCYNVPVINRCASDPEARALYLFPIKALEQDQLGSLRELAGAAGLADRVTAEIYDGDTPAHKRTRIRNQPPSVIITNPDMLHLSMLAFHAKWEKLLASLKFVILDEVHTYRGVFGSHVAHVLRRLFRLAARYGSAPQLIACSGTIANPGELASLLSGREVGVVDKNGAPEAGRHFLFINPTRLASSTVASRLLRGAIKHDLATIVFTKARKTTELIYTWTIQSEPGLAKLISAYRSGYLPEERREIEHQLFSGKMKGVVTTSALEMGIDIGVLDVCLLVGYPGAITTTWQRGGRVGRQDRSSLIVLIAGRDALDQYFMKHPRVFFDSGFEPAIVDPGNLPILKDHLCCAAAEEPLFRDDAWFSGPRVMAALAELEREGRMLKAVDEDAWHALRRQPQREVNIRGIGESNTIFEEPRTPLPPDQKPRVIGSIDGNRIYSEGHPGAIYLHRAHQYQVTRLDLGRKNLYARPVNVNYYTMPRKEKETAILSTKKSKPVKNFVTRLGELKVTERVIGYEKRAISSGERLSVHELSLPPYSFETVGLWIEIDDFIPRAVARARLNFMGGIHATEHAAIALFPLFALCERDDVGGISTPLHAEVGKGAIFIYDGYPGGVGLAEQAFARIEDLLTRTLELVSACECEKGCPACIYSNKCGSGNVPLDKQAAVMVLSLLLDRPEAQKWKELGQALPGPPEDGFPEEEEPEAPEDKSPRVLVVDVETRRGADEVGGWNNIHLMGLAVAVVWDSRTNALTSYPEDRADALLAALRQADLVVGFNILRFDYAVLSAYDDGSIASLPTFDILADLHRRLGFRLSLAHLAEHTLGAAKSADGLQSLEWVKQGRLDLVDEYCRHDVEITRDLFQHGLANHSLRFLSRDGKLLSLTVDWDLEKIIAQKKKNT